MRRSLILCVLLSGSCALRPAPAVRPEARGRYFIPLDAGDQDLVCALTHINVSVNFCMTVGEFRSIASSLKAEP
jgi:hypothetical protein